MASKRFADARGAGKDEAAGGPLGIFQSAAAAADRFRDAFDRFVLADDALVQLGFHRHQPHAVFGRHAGERDAGHLGDDFGDHFLVDDAVGLAQFSRQSRVIVCFFFFSLSAWSRRAAAFSKS